MRLRFLLPVLALPALPAPAMAQMSVLRGGGQQQQNLSRDQPVTFTADSVEYDRAAGIVTATGHVEAWQGDHILLADKVTFDRNTDIAAASGHVVLVEPDGQTLFSDYAELGQGMREGVLSGMSAILAQNGRLVANGARRVEGKVNELYRGVYSTCDLCAKDPSAPPLWQLRARSIVQDSENKRIEYQDAVLDVYGLPVAWFPYFWHADPSVKRASGVLVPSLGQSTHLGQFLSVPYYWVLDDQSDATITPTLATKSAPNLDVEYRRVFNDGRLRVNASVGYDQGALQGHVFSSGRFSLDDTWRYGFDINRASSETYLRDYRVQNQQSILTSQVFLEGFGEGAYSRVDARAYQALTGTANSSLLPYVLPRYQYSFFGEPDAWGGRLSADVSAFNVLREGGTNTQRAALSLNWERPFTGQLGDLWTLVLHNDAMAYNATSFNKSPNWSPYEYATTARDQPTGSLMVRWPFARTDGGSRQVIEPIAQLVVGPNTGNSSRQRIPNEDSLDFEFTDSNLFALNRYPGLDRIEGGVRANVGLHGAWYWGGTMLDGLIGQSYRTHKDDTFPIGSGLENRVSDVVARATLAPTTWLDFTTRGRFDKDNWKPHLAEAVARVGKPILTLTGGYLYSSTTPYYLYDQPYVPASYFFPRNEVTLGASTKFGRWSLAGYARRDVARNEMVATGVHGTYEDECFIFDVNFNRRYTSLAGDHGATTVLFQLTFKTVGQFGFHAF